jgi:hypothetical protein
MRYAGQYIAWGCPDISGRSFRVLCRMALTVMDEDMPDGTPEGMYWGGLHQFGAVLGYGLWDRESEMTPAARRAVARSIAELKAAGYISVAPKDKRQSDRYQTYVMHYPDPRKSRFTRD